MYNYNSALDFYPVSSITQQILPATNYILTYTRDASGTVTSYIDGNPGLTFVDSSNFGTSDGSLSFFVDDYPTGQNESSSGFVDFIRVYDTALTTGVTAVPEPASWSLLIAGFGLVGAAMRRRTSVLA